MSASDGLYTEVGDAEPDVDHVSRQVFTPNTRKHRLVLFKQLTRELARQELATWKKVIRVISHELNNSLAPISPLAHLEPAHRAPARRQPGRRDLRHHRGSRAAQGVPLLPFYSTKATGTGLGLTLCREIVEAHGGRLALFNREGGGVEVRIWLPR